MAGKMQLPLEVRFWMKVEKSDGCWKWTASKDGAGYGRLSRERGKGPLVASRVSWEIHFGNIPDGSHVLHRCDNPECTRPDHLFIGDAALNAADKSAKGRAKIEGMWLRNLRSAIHARRKLSTEQALEVVRLRRNGALLRELARQFDVHTDTIKMTLRRYPASGTDL
jgi:hypothetical protein